MTSIQDEPPDRLDHTHDDVTSDTIVAHVNDIHAPDAAEDISTLEAYRLHDGLHGWKHSAPPHSRRWWG